MKKLLSLLSVLTISSSAIPTTIAANPYQKEKNNFDNNETNNSLQPNNLKKRTGKMVQTININQYIPTQMPVYLPRGFAVNNNPPDETGIKNLAQLKIKEQSGIDIPIYSITLKFLTRSGVNIIINYSDSINNITYVGNQYTTFYALN